MCLVARWTQIPLEPNHQLVPAKVVTSSGRTPTSSVEPRSDAPIARRRPMTTPVDVRRAACRQARGFDAWQRSDLVEDTREQLRPTRAVVTGREQIHGTE